MSLLKQAVFPVLNQTAQTLAIAHFLDYEKEINKCCLSICYATAKQLGLFRIKGESFTLEQLARKNLLAPDACYVLKQILFMLTEDRLLSLTDNLYTVESITDMESPPEMLVALTRKYPQEGASFQWLARAYGGMYDLLAGRINAEDLLFPWGSFELLEDLYFSSIVYGFFPLLAASAVKNLLQYCYKDKVSILEIGAGTGNGTVQVLEQLDNRCSCYLYTDVMRSMLKKAKTRFAKYPFMEYKLYDVNKDPGIQNITNESVDIIIAVNVLHAVNNIMQSLHYLKSLLRQGGNLVLAEIGPPQNSLYRYMELTFGLLPSYHAYEDKELRPLSPIIRPGDWAKALISSGFREVIFVPSEEAQEFDRGGLVIGVK